MARDKRRDELTRVAAEVQTLERALDKARKLRAARVRAAAEVMPAQEIAVLVGRSPAWVSRVINGEDGS